MKNETNSHIHVSETPGAGCSLYYDSVLRLPKMLHKWPLTSGHSVHVSRTAGALPQLLGLGVWVFDLWGYSYLKVEAQGRQYSQTTRAPVFTISMAPSTDRPLPIHKTKPAGSSAPMDQDPPSSTCFSTLNSVKTSGLLSSDFRWRKVCWPRSGAYTSALGSK